MPNNDYVLRSDALAYVRHAYPKGLNLLMAYINVIPTADVEPVRHGRWIPIHELRPDGYPLSVPTCFWCDQCKYSSESPRKFCPNCGAKMDAGTVEGEKR